MKVLEIKLTDRDNFIYIAKYVYFFIDNCFKNFANAWSEADRPIT